jgi:tetratricopeptide (TPR) repeat protein
MPQISLKPITSRPPAVIAGLTLLAILAFIGVTRLVNRFAEQQKALARHLYDRAVSEQRNGKPELAIEHLREALIYNSDNFDYQLQLARALRDTGRTEESEAYLVSLWERNPQDGTVNLALGRLAARQRLLDKTLQYYHNAIYGVWASNPDQNRVAAWFELIEFLLRQNARQQAEAELIPLAAELPLQTDLRLRAAELFTRTQDYEHALAEYEQVLKIDHENARALAGAGEAAFKLARYRTAERLLKAATSANPLDTQVAQLLEVSRLVLERDPFPRDISMEERNDRLSTIFDEAGKRLDNCGASSNAAQSSPEMQSAAEPPMKAEWLKMKPKLSRLRSSREADLPDEVMDLVLKIEQQTQSCPPTPTDEALLLLAQNRRSEP